MAVKRKAVSKQAGQALVIVRVFDAPRDLVWKAWTDPDLFKRWMGPKNFTTPVARMELREGGKYLNCMRAPDGKEYWSTGTYREIVPMVLLSMTDSFADEHGNLVPASHYDMTGDWPLELQVTVTFEETDGATKMNLQHTGIPPGRMRDETQTGWNESFDKLAAAVTEPGVTRIIAEPGKHEMVFTRVFDAPREAVFRAYTDPDLIPRWWGPRRFETIVDRMDARSGGTWRYINRDAGGIEYGFHGVYHTVDSPDRIVSTFEFEGMPGHVSLEFAIFEEQDGKTKLTGRSVYRSIEDRDKTLESGMIEGLSETLDRLAELLTEPDIRKKAA